MNLQFIKILLFKELSRNSGSFFFKKKKFDENTALKSTRSFLRKFMQKNFGKDPYIEIFINQR